MLQSSPTAYPVPQASTLHDWKSDACFDKFGVLFWGPYNSDHTTLKSVLGPLTLGNSQLASCFSLSRTDAVLFLEDRGALGLCQKKPR